MNGTVSVPVVRRRKNMASFLSFYLLTSYHQIKMPLMVLQTPITTGEEKHKRLSDTTQSVCTDTHEIHWSLIFAIGIHLEHGFPHVLLPAGLHK